MYLETQNSLIGFLLCYARTWNTEFYCWPRHLTHLSHTVRAPWGMEKVLAVEELSEEWVEWGAGHPLPVPTTWVIREQEEATWLSWLIALLCPMGRASTSQSFSKHITHFNLQTPSVPFPNICFWYSLVFLREIYEEYFEILIWQLMGYRDQSSVLFGMIYEMRINSTDSGGRHTEKWK